MSEPLPGFRQRTKAGKLICVSRYGQFVWTCNNIKGECFGTTEPRKIKLKKKKKRKRKKIEQLFFSIFRPMYGSIMANI